MGAGATGGARAVARCDALGVAPYSDVGDGLFRAYLTPAHARTQDAIGAWMIEAGMAVDLDPAANLVGRYAGTDPDAPALLIGSHIDSVRDAGRYDGPLGVMLGIECVAALAAEGRRPRFAIEVIAFGDEEGSRFPAAMLTSRAVAGTLAPDALAVADAEGVALGDALAAFPPSPRWGKGRGEGLPSSDAADSPLPTLSPREDGFLGAARPPGSVFAYLEPHIEQGPVLEAEGLALGTVTGIAAQLRLAARVTGIAGHAGTNAMHLRRDALAAAAAMVLAVESAARDAGGDVVATVGKLEVLPGAANVVPGAVAFTIDIRSGDAARRDATSGTIFDALADIADTRGVEVTIERVHDLPASPCDPALMDLMDAAVAATGQRAFRLVSGAGHDAMAMAALCPTAMLFVRCRGGVSHNPAEHVDPADADAALRAMLGFIDRLDRAP